MKKWNMIIDVAECTNCQLCTLATMDEYVGNDWPGYSAPMPRHGHRWIDIKQKERGPGADDRHRLSRRPCATTATTRRAWPRAATR